MTLLICYVVASASIEPGAIVSNEDSSFCFLHNTGNHLSGYMVS